MIIWSLKTDASVVGCTSSQTYDYGGNAARDYI